MREGTFKSIALAAVAAAASFGMTALQAQTGQWRPDHPVILVVPYAPGGSVDAVARVTAKALAARIGQPVLVENQPGAEGLIGSRRVMDAKPDGYTLLIQIPAITLTKYMPGLKGIDPVSQLAAITSIAETPALLVSSAKIPATTLKDFVQYCRTSAEPCSMGSGEATGRLRAKQVASEANLPNLISVSYKGTSPIVSDLISGVVSMSNMNIPVVQQHYKNGTIRILAVQDAKRSPMLPDVPTSTEAGFPQFQNTTWFGLFTARATPKPLLDSIAAALQSVKTDPELLRTLSMAGAVPVFNTPTEFAAQVGKEDKMWSQLVKRYPFD